MIRKCIFTGLDAYSKSKLLFLDKTHPEIHNWSNSVPCNSDYATFKQNRSPTASEISCFNLFWQVELLKMLELTKAQNQLMVEVLEQQLLKFQAINLKSFNEWLKTKPENKTKEKEIKKAYAEKEIVESLNTEIDSFFSKKSKLWEE